MRDGQLFPYGSSSSMEFFQLPEGYEFSDVVEVINHSYLDANGSVASLECGAVLPTGYSPDSVLRERVFFVSGVDGI